MDDLEILRRFAPTFAIQLLTAFLCGGLLGFQRERAGSPAGLKTNILVCVGATLYMLTGRLITETMGAGHAVDPTRVASQIVTGIGFLGAGTILQSDRGVRGLTSAATIWFIGAVGILIGCHYPLLGLMATLLVLVLMSVARRIEIWAFRSRREASNGGAGGGEEPPENRSNPAGRGL